MFCVFLISLCLSGSRAMTLDSYSQVTSQLVIDYLITLQTERADEVAIDAEQAWANTTMAMRNLNTALSLAVANVSALYDPVGAALFTAAINPSECTLANAAVYESNATELQAFFCCHLRKIRVPAILSVLSRAHTIFHGTPKDDDFGSTAAALQGLQTLQYLETVGAVVRACIDDVSIIDPERASVRAVSALEIVADLSEAYLSIYLDAVSLSGCVNQPLAGCNQTTPLLWEQVQPNIAFASYDRSYLTVCSLGAFEQQQVSSTCTSLPAYG